MAIRIKKTYAITIAEIDESQKINNKVKNKRQLLKANSYTTSIKRW